MFWNFNCQYLLALNIFDFFCVEIKCTLFFPMGDRFQVGVSKQTIRQQLQQKTIASLNYSAKFL